tara:strand:- start:426 stop:1667 length:1242 start_codon:yes stop_codon:yes gene_type:complete
MSNFNLDKLNFLGDYIVKEYIPQYFPGFSLSIYENNKESYYVENGFLDIEKKISVSRETIFRIFSMTKPIVSTAAMKLFELKKFDLIDPVTKFIPEWKNLKEYKSGSRGKFQVENLTRPMRILDLFTHTAGLTYALQRVTPIDKEYRKLGIENVVDSRGFHGTKSSDEIINLLAQIPLEFSPGDFYHYSLAIDILGFIIERISNQPLDDYLKENIFRPLGMKDTSFYVDKSSAYRLAPCYRWSEEKGLYQDLDKNKDPKIKYIDFFNKPKVFSGGAGLLSTMNDYQQFGSALLNARLGESNPLVKQETAKLMMVNHLRGGLDMTEISKTPLAGEEYYKGIGFGLGGSVVVDPKKNLNKSYKGDFGWGGAAGTSFFISPQKKYSLIFLTQVLESEENRRLNKDIRNLTNSALLN